MKPNLGRFLILLIFTTFLCGEDFKHSIKANKNEAFVKEVVVLNIELEQTNKKIILLYDFDLVKSDKYHFKRVEALESDIDHNSKATYTYLLYPLIDGDIAVEFKLIKKVTTDENLAYSFSGDRDNVKGLSTKNTEVKLPPLMVKVKPLPKDVKLVGDFKLSYFFKTKEALAYEPITSQIKIEGVGYLPEFEDFGINTEGFKIFRDTPIVKFSTSKTDISSTTTYPIAFSSDQNFTLQEIIIKAYNPKTDSIYELKVPKQEFKINQTTQLVDKTDYPKPVPNYTQSALKNLESYLSYIVIFLAGMLSGYLLKSKTKDKTLKIKSEKEMIDDAKDDKELLKILISLDPIKYKEQIKNLESFIYKDKR